MSHNRISGDLYIANEESDNVSLIRNQSFVGNLDTGNMPTHVESNPKSDMVYVTNLFTGIATLNSGMITGYIPAYSEPFHIAVNKEQFRS